jgi:hypothetical protein
MRHPLRWFQRLRRALRLLRETDGQGYDEKLIRAFRGVCPHCDKGLVWKKHSGKVFADAMKACPDNHFAVEYHGHGVVTYHDREGNPIDYLFTRNFQILKNDQYSETRKIPRQDSEAFDDPPEKEIEDED